MMRGRPGVNGYGELVIKLREEVGDTFPGRYWEKNTCVGRVDVWQPVILFGISVKGDFISGYGRGEKV